MTTRTSIVFLTFALLLLSFTHAMTSCKPGSFLFSGKCQLCPAGTFQDESNATSCKPCPAGYYYSFQGAPGIDLCQPCKAGTFSRAIGAKSSSTCRRCPKGKDSLEGSPKCISCPKGQIISKCPLAGEFDTRIIPGRCTSCFQSDCSSEPAKLKCRPCEAGEFSMGVNSKRCTRCPEGLISLPGSARCTTCPTGKGGQFFVGNNRVEICRPCANLRYNDGKSGSCRGCPPGFQGNARNGAVRCVPCPKGTFGLPPFGGRCRPCPQGQNSNVTGATACLPDDTPCPKNFFRNFRGACEKCTKRQRYSKEKGTCEDCGKDEASDGGLARRCKKCPKGETGFVNLAPLGVFAGDKGCICKEGLIRLRDGKCTACPAGSIKKFPNSRECTACPPGTFAPRSGMTECVPCPVDMAQRLHGQTKCVKCARGLIPGLTDGQFFPGRGSPRCADPTTNCAPDETRRLSTGAGPLGGGPAGAFKVQFCVKGKPRPCRSGEFQVVSDTGRHCVECAVNEVGKNGKCKECVGASTRVLGKCTCVSGVELVQGLCRECRPGTFAPTGTTGCEPCPAGTFRPTKGGRDCTECRPGRFSEAGAVKCTVCPAGTVTYGRANANCVKPGSLRRK